MRAPLDLDREGRNWPHRDKSRFVEAGGTRFHVQTLGPEDAPPLLLLHGTGASTHSFRDLAPCLAERYRVIMPDLPGHGFTATPPWRRVSITGMSGALLSLLDALQVSPAYAAGHSAGAAILLRMALDGQIAPRRIVSLNGALLPFPGIAAHLFPRLAKLLFLNPVAPHFFAWRARSGGAVAQLMESTGSKIDAAGIAYYKRLLASPTHVDGALSMMANWDLDSLGRDLPRLAMPLTLIVGTRDRAIPPEVSERVARMVHNAEVVSLAGLGHLAHEEAPDEVAGTILAALERDTEPAQPSHDLAVSVANEALPENAAFGR
ncbi:alpha/beta fold hydrolase [Jiella sp. MQZ9-1]|uniref:Alpha/beta fold hydrolase n=1 Tax=Jiella flava TaxID=2816857 RepID=A0A939FX28_9HYPH|nr:alpha/beta fold hydrolase BchO [Jiella flava]MBO0661750.1 alpha/beta fold hydrolase [Jiella flava]MCD2470391.1 alpha/beta fold hydrolase [Jiella flava]